MKFICVMNFKEFHDLRDNPKPLKKVGDVSLYQKNSVWYVKRLIGFGQYDTPEFEEFQVNLI